MGGKNSSLTSQDVNNLIDQKINAIDYFNKYKLEDNSIELKFASNNIKQRYYNAYPDKNAVYDYDNSYLRDQDNRTLYAQYSDLKQYDILAQEERPVNIIDMTKKIIDAIDSENSSGSYDWQSQSGNQGPSRDNNKIEFFRFKRKNILRDALKYETKHGQGSIIA